MFKNQLNNKTILIVEDDVFSIDLLAEYFSLTGAEIIYAKNGLEAVKLCKNNPQINLILMDIKFPVKDGIEATTEIRKFRKNIPIIAQTTGALPNEITSICTCGINDYVLKPYKQSDIINKVKEYLAINSSLISI